MAIAASLLTSGYDDTPNDPATTASVSPTTGATLFLSVANWADYGPNTSMTSAVTGLSGTWTLVSGGQWAVRRGLAVYSCDDWSGSGTLSIDFTGTLDGGNVLQGMGWSLVEVTGLEDDLLPFVLGPTVFDTASGAGTSWSPTFAVNPGDATLAFFSIENNVAISNDAGWTELTEIGETSGMRRHTAIWDVDGDTTPAFSWSGAAGYGGVGIVLRAASNTLANDDFNRANESLTASSNWANLGAGFVTADIVSNVVQSSGADNGAYWQAGTFGADQWVEADISLTGSTAGGAVLWVRRTANNATYAAEWAVNGTVTLYNVTSGGGWASIGSDTGHGTSGTLRLEVVGTQITVYLDGVEIITQSNSTHTTGRPGFHIFHSSGTAPTLDNFSAGDWTTGTDATITGISAAVATATAIGVALVDVYGLTATKFDDERIDLAWDAWVSSATVVGYQIERDGVVVAQVGAGTTSYPDTGLTADTTYDYRVRAVVAS